MSTESSANRGATDLNDAIARHQAGRLSEAESLYRQFLETNPDNPDAVHLLGVVAHQMGDHERALILIDRALGLKPGSPGFHNNRGEVLRALGRDDEAVVDYHKAININPRDASAHINLGNILQASGKLEEALSAFRNALSVDPDSVEALYNLGNALKAGGQLDEAADTYRRAIVIDPGIPQLHSNLGGVLMAQGLAEDAQASYYRALDIEPSFVDAHASLGLMAVSGGNLQQAVGHYGKACRLRRSPGATDDFEPTFRKTTRAKLEHDIEQLRYLLSRGLIGSEYEAWVVEYETVLNELSNEFERHYLVPLPKRWLNRLAPVYNRLIHYEPCDVLPGPAVNPDIDAAAVQCEYRNNAPGIVYADDLLTPAALDGLRRFCLESTIWFKCDYEHGYLAAVMDEGFLCPLLAQIAEELPGALPDVFKDHRLTQMWAFKYDSKSPGGVGMHADFAAVNVNFWITPDSANRSTEGGGLIVWDKEAPMEWSFETYNMDQQSIVGFLEDSNASAIKIPHRANRAVIFNSDLFHRTDDLDFAPGYENRRINITMLYGTRERS